MKMKKENIKIKWYIHDEMTFKQLNQLMNDCINEMKEKIYHLLIGEVDNKTKEVLKNNIQNHLQKRFVSNDKRLLTKIKRILLKCTAFEKEKMIEPTRNYYMDLLIKANQDNSLIKICYAELNRKVIGFEIINLNWAPYTAYVEAIYCKPAYRMWSTTSHLSTTVEEYCLLNNISELFTNTEDPRNVSLFHMNGYEYADQEEYNVIMHKKIPFYNNLSRKEG